MRLEEPRVFFRQQREGIAPKPFDDRVRRKFERGRSGRHERHQLFEIIVPQRRIDAVELSCFEQAVPGVLAIFSSNYFFEQIENNTLHRITPVEEYREAIYKPTR